MKKIDSLLPVLLSIGLILVLLYLGVILIMMAFSAPRAAGMGLDWGDGGGEDTTTSAEVIHLGRLDVGAHGPGRVAVDSEGRFYITDPERYRVFVTDANGENTVTVDTCAYPSAITVGPDGQIFLGDALTHAVWVLDAQGQFLFALGAGQDEFGWPHDIAVEPVWGDSEEPISGRVYVADGPSNRVKVYDSEGSYLFTITGPETDPLSFPNGIAVDPNGLYLVVSDHNNGRLQLFGTDGNWIRSFGSLIRPAGLDLDGQGNIYVSDSFQSQVFIFDLEGNSLGSVGQYGDEPGDLKVPTDSALDPYGRLVAVSYNNGVLELYGPEGYSEPPAEVAAPAISSLTNTPCFVPPPPNQPPVAYAVAEDVVPDSDGDGVESVTLDGSGSSDPDGAIVSFDWFEGNTKLGSGAILTVTFSVGTHTITLVVTDDDGATGTDTVVVKVAVVGTVVFKPHSLKLSGGGKDIKAFIELPDNLAADIDVTTVVLNDQVPAELNGWKLNDFNGNGIVEMRVLFDRDAVQSLFDPPPPGPEVMEMVVTGLLVNGEAFEAYGTLEVKP